MQTVYNWVVISIALACSIVMFVLIKPFLLSGSGLFGPGILQAQSVGAAVVAMLATLAVGTFMACVLSRFMLTGTFWFPGVLNVPSKEILAGGPVDGTIHGTCIGLLILGIGLGWMSLQLESIQVVVLGGSMSALAAEGIAWGALLLLMSVAVYRFGGRLVTPMTNDRGEEDDWARSPAALKMAASGACVLPVVWLIAQSPMKGQVLAATIVGSMAAGFVGRLVAPTVQPLVLFSSVCVCGALGQWAAGLWLPQDPAAMVAAGQLPHILLPLPIDYAAGSLIGIPIGLAWGNGFIQKEGAGADSPASAT